MQFFSIHQTFIIFNGTFHFCSTSTTSEYLYSMIERKKIYFMRWWKMSSLISWMNMNGIHQSIFLTSLKFSVGILLSVIYSKSLLLTFHWFMPSIPFSRSYFSILKVKSHQKYTIFCLVLFLDFSFILYLNYWIENL